MADVGVDYYAVSSTTMCEENYAKVLDEMHELIALDGEKVFPVMWITPEGLKGNIAWFLESDIRWRCLKVHPELHPDDWEPCSGQFEEVADIALELNVPLLIHTGNNECCLCGKYEKLVEAHPNVTFILAHGRPVDDALRMVSLYDNAYVDTAFMPIEDIAKFLHGGYDKKLLWGTDMCIPHHFFPKENLTEYYKRKLQNVKCLCSQEQFESITFKNTVRIIGTGLCPTFL